MKGLESKSSLCLGLFSCKKMNRTERAVQAKCWFDIGLTCVFYTVECYGQWEDTFVEHQQTAECQGQ